MRMKYWLMDQATTEGDTGTGAADTAAKAETTAAPAAETKTEAAPAKTEAAAPNTTIATDAAKTEDTAKAAPVEIKLELPKDSKLHQTDVDRIAATARERGLSQEQATALLTEADTAARGFEKRLVETVAAKRAEWVTTVKADPEIGGANLAKTNANAMRVVERFMSPALREELRTTGYGDHPELVRFLSKVGAAMAEDTPPDGGKPAISKPTPEQVLYGEVHK